MLRGNKLSRDKTSKGLYLMIVLGEAILTKHTRKNQSYLYLYPNQRCNNINFSATERTIAKCPITTVLSSKKACQHHLGTWFPLMIILTDRILMSFPTQASSQECLDFLKLLSMQCHAKLSVVELFLQHPIKAFQRIALPPVVVSENDEPARLIHANRNNFPARELLFHVSDQYFFYRNCRVWNIDEVVLAQLQKDALGFDVIFGSSLDTLLPNVFLQFVSGSLGASAGIIGDNCLDYVLNFVILQAAIQREVKSKRLGKSCLHHW